ncbi:MAG: metallophosphoesterase family protein [Candidatus Hydrogenedentes bacterium]|nr:metallophosphoesterase family protein [Candidatus Hydrogenedentota bacterium]
MKVCFTPWLVLGLVMVLELVAGAAPLHTYLTWQGDTSQTMTVTYHTPADSGESLVYYDIVPRGGVAASYAHSATGAVHTLPGLDAFTPRFVHVVELTGLSPGATYYFVAGDSTDGFTSERAFQTLPAGNAPLRFVAGGDMGVTSDVPPLLTQAASLAPMFAMVGGDLAYENGVLANWGLWETWLNYWEQYMVTPAGLTVPMILAIGNHEVNGGFAQTPAQAPFFNGYFPQNGTTSYFARELGGNAVLLVLDSGHTVPHSGAQAAWLENALLQYQDRVTMALYHVPLYPGHRDFNGAYSVYGRTHWLPLFDQYQLTVAFENHDHVLKRTKRLRGGVADPEGTLYLGDGCMGVAPREGDQAGQPYIDRVLSERHFWFVEIPAAGARNTQDITFTAIDSTGAAIDVTNLPIPVTAAIPAFTPAGVAVLVCVILLFSSVVAGKAARRL